MEVGNMHSDRKRSFFFFLEDGDFFNAVYDLYDSDLFLAMTMDWIGFFFSLVIGGVFLITGFGWLFYG